MTAVTIRQVEGQPASRPTIALEQLEHLNGETPLTELGRLAALVPQGPVWARLEAWMAARWGERTVVWYV